MGRAKEILVKVIPAKIANEFVKQNHYSGKVVPNSTLHFGCFLDGKLHGVLSYGTSMDKRKILPLVENTLWNEMLELNRMAFDEYLPKYSESRCIAITIKLLKKNAPHIKWILSYSDATQCGDGTIYRASGFYLTGIKENKTILEWNGKIIADKTLNNSNYKKLGMSAGKAKKDGDKKFKVGGKVYPVKEEKSKYYVEIDSPREVDSNRVKAEVKSFMKRGARAADIGLRMNFLTTDPKDMMNKFQKVKNHVYFFFSK
jgi:hypothetical protein